MAYSNNLYSLTLLLLSRIIFWHIQTISTLWHSWFILVSSFGIFKQSLHSDTPGAYWYNLLAYSNNLYSLTLLVHSRIIFWHIQTISTLWHSWFILVLSFGIFKQSLRSDTPGSYSYHLLAYSNNLYSLTLLVHTGISFWHIQTISTLWHFWFILFSSFGISKQSLLSDTPGLYSYQLLAYSNNLWSLTILVYSLYLMFSHSNNLENFHFQTICTVRIRYFHIYTICTLSRSCWCMLIQGTSTTKQPVLYHCTIVSDIFSPKQCACCNTPSAHSYQILACPENL